MASRPSKLDFWSEFQPEPRQIVMASRPFKFDSWSKFRSGAGQIVMARRPSKFDSWSKFRSGAGQCDMARRPSKFDSWSKFQSGLENVTWPEGLQSLTFRSRNGARLAESDVVLPRALRTLVTGEMRLIC